VNLLLRFVTLHILFAVPEHPIKIARLKRVRRPVETRNDLMRGGLGYARQRYSSAWIVHCRAASESAAGDRY
jgi:hypothetical protein